MHEYLLFKTNARDIDHMSDVPSIHEIQISFPIQASGPRDIRVRHWEDWVSIRLSSCDWG